MTQQPDTPDASWWASRGHQVAIDAILGLLGKMDAEQRESVLIAIRRRYCFQCYRERCPDGYCPCMNDDVC